MRSYLRGWAGAGAALLVLVVAAATGTAAGAVPSAAAADTATLSLFKQIENLDTGSSEGRRELWTMHAVEVNTGQTYTGDGLNGFQTRVIPAGTYRISESGGVAGYRFVHWACGATTYTTPTAQITLTAGQNLTCTVDNEAVKPGLTLRKQVNGGSAPATAWQLRAQGPVSISGVSGSPQVTNQPVRIGDYTLSEAAGPTGYTAGAWQCTAVDASGASVPVTLTGDVVSIGLGRFVTCTVTNTAVLPHLTLVKQVDNSGGGGATPDEWTLTATGPQTVSGASGSAAVSHVTVAAGTYTLAESGGPAGYRFDRWSCTGATGFTGTTATVTGGDDVTCTATNTFEGGRLTLRKVVDGGSAPVTAWTLTATGTGGAAGTTVSGASGTTAVTDAPVPAGTYTLTETGPSGYTAGDWTCDNGDTGGSVTVAAGGSVACTITNTLHPPVLTLVKQVVNAGGGTATPQDWTLSATGPVTVSGPSGSVSVSHVAVEDGVFTLAETGGPAGYDAGAWSCTGAAMPTATTVDIVSDADVTCTITNTWTGATLTLDKQVANVAAGGTGAPSDWTLSAAGPTPFSGPGDSAAVTLVPIEPGTYQLSESGGPPGYDALGWTCVGGSLSGSTVTVAPGTAVTCTSLNVAVMPSLTLAKVVDNTGGGTATADDFTLKARGPGNAALSGVSGTAAVTRFLGPAGPYVLSETGPAGYQGTWTCTGATAQQGLNVVVGLGQDVVCTATNRWTGGHLTLVKEVVGGPATAADWTLTATGADVTASGTSGTGAVTAVPVPPGDYTLSESASTAIEGQYRSDGWRCTGGDFTGDVVTVPASTDVTCTAVNTFTGGPGGPGTGGPGPGGDGGRPGVPGATPTPSPAPSAATSAGGRGLPFTGAPLAAELAVAAGTLAAGVTLVTRRRRARG